VGLFLVSTNTLLPLTNPLDALLLPRVLRWVAVVFRQKSRCGYLDADGRPWTRLPAKDLVAQLEREEGLEVTVRRVQRSLVRLAEAGYLVRTQRTKWWGQRDWWYSWSDAEWELQQCRPTAVGRRVPSAVTVQVDAKRRSEASVPTVQVLSTQTLKNQTSKSDPTAKQSGASHQNGKSGCAGLQAAPAETGGANPRRQGQNRSQRALGALNAVMKRVAKHGTAQSEAPSPEEQWVQGGFVFTRLASGHVVKDSVATAPLR
jgi:hypothetical protein